MKRFFTLAFTIFAFSTSAFAQANVASQQVTINVNEIAVISVVGNVSMTINAATAGQAPDAVTAASTYHMTTNG